MFALNVALKSTRYRLVIAKSQEFGARSSSGSQSPVNSQSPSHCILPFCVMFRDCNFTVRKGTIIVKCIVRKRRRICGDYRRCGNRIWGEGYGIDNRRILTLSRHLISRSDVQINGGAFFLRFGRETSPRFVSLIRVAFIHDSMGV